MSVQTGAVLYAKELRRLGEFYSSITKLEIRERDAGYLKLESDSFQLVILQIPATIAESIAISAPPEPRQNNPIKLVFFVDSLDGARSRMADLGGSLNGAEKEWEFENCAVCDGIDPEGNVFQLRSGQGESGEG